MIPTVGDDVWLLIVGDMDTIHSDEHNNFHWFAK